MTRMATMRSDGALAKARNIFGDIVDGVYVTTGVYSDGDDDDCLYRLICAEEKVSDSSDDEICYDALEIWIKFTNGKTVCFHNSEWGSIGGTEDAVVVEVEPIHKVKTPSLLVSTCSNCGLLCLVGSLNDKTVCNDCRDKE